MLGLSIYPAVELSQLRLIARTYALTEIKSIEVRDSTDSYDRISYVPTIVMSSGKTFDLMSSFNQQGAESMATDIRTFLGMQTL